MIISLLAQNSWKIYQMDVKFAFRNGVLEEVYVKQLAEYVVEGKEDKVYKLKEGFVWVETSTRAWYKKTDSWFVHNVFERCPCEHILYVKSIDPGDILIVCLYVDDLIFTGINSKLIVEFREAMISCFEMTDSGLVSYFLGIEVNKQDDGFCIS